MSSSSSSSLSGHPLEATFLLPPYWEQCLHLKTGEVNYINSKTGMKVKTDPRSQEEEDSESDDSSSSDESLELFASSSSSSSLSSSTTNTKRSSNKKENIEETVLVVAGCKRCFMYFMVPKKLQDCPKCTTHLLHFHHPFP